MCAFEIFWNPPQGVDHGKPEKLSLTEKNFPVASILMPQPDLPFEGGIKIDATRLKPAFALAFWRQNGAKPRRSLVSGAKTEPIYRKNSSHHPTATFEPPKWHLFWNCMKYFSERPVCSYREPVFAWSLHSLTATWRAKKRHPLSDFLKIFLYSRTARFWGKKQTPGWKFPSTPVPQHPKQKSKHGIESFSSTT